MEDELTNSVCYQEILSTLRRDLPFLADKSEETADATLRALWHTASGKPMSAGSAQLTPLEALDDKGLERLRNLVAQRLEGRPLAHIVGRQQFMGLELLAGPEALIPRKETEILGKAALELLEATIRVRGGALVIDACCGSGNLAVALAVHSSDVRVMAADISAAAVELARKNVSMLQLADRVSVTQGDLLDPFDSDVYRGQVDLITCNPPYISSAKLQHLHREVQAYEPHEAFDGGPLGIRILQRLIRDPMRLLRDGGWLAFEVGLGQGPAVLQRLQKEGRYRALRHVCDESDQIRVVLAQL